MVLASGCQWVNSFHFMSGNSCFSFNNCIYSLHEGEQ